MTKGIRHGFFRFTSAKCTASRQVTGTGEEFINQRIPGHVDHAHAYIHESTTQSITSNWHGERRTKYKTITVETHDLQSSEVETMMKTMIITST